LVCDWEEMLHQITKCTPETEPGSEQMYHYLSFGWLCGGIIEVCLSRASHTPSSFIFNGSTEPF
jgi:hypothetical protein